MKNMYLSEDEYKEFNNTIAIPEFRKFCKDNNFKLHFWDEESFDFAIAHKQRSLMNEALTSFNLHNSKYYHFKGLLIGYTLNCSGISSLDVIALEQLGHMRAENELNDQYIETIYTVYAIVAFLLGEFVIVTLFPTTWTTPLSVVIIPALISLPFISYRVRLHLNSVKKKKHIENIRKATEIVC